MKERVYIAIDLKSFYASVECRERGLDPLTTNLVVADASRTEKTICLAVSPSLKAYGIPGRARLFEVIQKVKQMNEIRKRREEEAITFITATPQMALYMEYSTKIHEIYLRYIAPEDMHVYSIDEVFIDATQYLYTYGMTPRELAMKLIREVLKETGITATAGIGTNLYLCKIAMDIMAKHIPADKDGVRIAQLDEMSYRRKLWNHTPITDFWRVGRGYERKLSSVGLKTMGDIARCSVGKEMEFYNEDLLYRLFGVNAELLIDHAWGYEPCTMEDIKSYRPENNSLSSGQVLRTPYSFEKARLVVWEMVDQLVLELVDKRLVTNQIVLTVGFDKENLETERQNNNYSGTVTTDRYGRKVPKHAHGSKSLSEFTSSTKKITDATLELYDEIVNKNLSIRRLTVEASHVIGEEQAKEKNSKKYEQLDFFTDYEALSKRQEKEKEEQEREKKMQHAVLEIKKKFGKNAILKGANLYEDATARERNGQIGGHKA